jgi:hypothetical protein
MQENVYQETVWSFNNFIFIIPGLISHDQRKKKIVHSNLERLFACLSSKKGGVGGMYTVHKSICTLYRLIYSYS